MSSEFHKRQQFGLSNLFSNSGYYETLERYALTSAGRLKGDISALNIASGVGLDLEDQARLLINSRGSKEERVSITSLDIRAEALVASLSLPRDSFDDRVNYDVLPFSAETLGLIPIPIYTAIFVSHPECYSQKELWGGIIDSVSTIAKTPSLFVSTFYDEDEMNILAKMLDPHFKLVVKEKNAIKVDHAPAVQMIFDSSCLPGYAPHSYILVAER